MNPIIHERPGVYSSYDASSLIRGRRAARTVAVAARSKSGEKETLRLLTSYEAGISFFGEDDPASPGMSTLLKLLFAGGVTTVAAMAVDPEKGYASAFSLLENQEEVQLVICDSDALEDQKALRVSVEKASACRRERIGVVGMSGAAAQELIARAEALNSERMVLVGPDVLDEAGNALSGVFAAAAVAAVIACSYDPALPINGAPLPGLGGVSVRYEDNDIDLLVRGGVTPLEAVGGLVSPVRGVTTRSMTGSVKDSSWREITTILVVDNVIPSIRESLRSRFTRAKNTAQTRGAIRSQVILELESKLRAQIIERYSDVTVSVYDQDPTVALVEFSFAVAHGLNQIFITAHITI